MMAVSQERVRKAAIAVEAVMTWLWFANDADFDKAFGKSVGAHLWGKWKINHNMSTFLSRLDNQTMRQLCRVALERRDNDSQV